MAWLFVILIFKPPRGYFMSLLSKTTHKATKEINATSLYLSVILLRELTTLRSNASYFSKCNDTSIACPSVILLRKWPTLRSNASYFSECTVLPSEFHACCKALDLSLGFTRPSPSPTGSSCVTCVRKCTPRFRL